MKRHLVWLAATLIVACGTDTGNPGKMPKPNMGADRDSFSQNLVQITCEKLAACHLQLDQETCGTSLFALTGLDEEFGLEQGRYANWASVHAAELSGELTLADAPAAAACHGEVIAMACSDERVQAAYQHGEEQPFENLERLFPYVCRGVF